MKNFLHKLADFFAEVRQKFSKIAEVEGYRVGSSLMPDPYVLATGGFTLEATGSAIYSADPATIPEFYRQPTAPTFGALYDASAPAMETATRSAVHEATASASAVMY